MLPTDAKDGFAVFRKEGGGQQYDDLGRAIAPYEDTAKCSSMGQMLVVHKAFWLPLGLAGMVYQHFVLGAVSTRMLLMTGLFGSYGLVWVFKSNIYPDLQFYNSEATKITGVGDYIFKFCLIGIYFIFPITAAFNTEPIQHWQVVVCIVLFCSGGFFHWAGDAQRYFQLKYHPGHLITQNFYAHMRHPSYFGEIVIWISLSLMSPLMWFGASWIPLLYLLLLVLFVLGPQKEKSLSRYPEWEEYKARTPMLIPNPFSCGRAQPSKPTTELLAAGP